MTDPALAFARLGSCARHRVGVGPARVSRLIIVLALSISVHAIPAAAQPVESGEVIVRSNDLQAGVLADTTWLGPVSSSPFRLPVGTYRIAIVPGDPGTWGRSTITREVTVQTGAPVTVHGHFPRVYHLESDPVATIELVTDDSVTVLGQTPLLFESSSSVTGRFRFSADGFVPADTAAGTAFWNRQFVGLTPRIDAPGGHFTVDMRKARAPRRWIDYAAVGVSLAAGIVAVHYKLKADRQFDIYRETGDPTLRPIIRRYDTYSGFAVGTMQAGLTLFTIRLIRR